MREGHAGFTAAFALRVFARQGLDQGLRGCSGRVARARVAQVAVVTVEREQCREMECVAKDWAS